MMEERMPPVGRVVYITTQCESESVGLLLRARSHLSVLPVNIVRLATTFAYYSTRSKIVVIISIQLYITVFQIRLKSVQCSYNMNKICVFSCKIVIYRLAHPISHCQCHYCLPLSSYRMDTFLSSISHATY
jgi:hypothetical protein